MRTVGLVIKTEAKAEPSEKKVKKKESADKVPAPAPDAE